MTEPAIHIFAHRGRGVTDIGPQDAADAKGEGLKELPPENSREAVEWAFKNGFAVEIDVTMTKDGRVIVTHTDDLGFHNAVAKNARERAARKGAEAGDDNWYVSRKTFAEMKRLKTGLGGRTAPFLTYEDLISLMRDYPSAVVNVEIKGTIGTFMAESRKPSLVEKLAQLTPDAMLERIIWSSFANSNIMEIRKVLKEKSGRPRANMPHVRVAQLFAEPGRLSPHGGEEDSVYPDALDRYMQFTEENVAKAFRQDIAAVHPCIDSLMTEEGRGAVRYCARNGIAIRTWALNEKNPEKDSDASRVAKTQIEHILELKERYPTLEIDIITDYPEEVERLVSGNAVPRPEHGPSPEGHRDLRA